ncbi:MAG: heme-binding domain-containing protein [Bacteroidota bacterium]
MLKKIMLGLLALVVLIQFFQPDRNESEDTQYALHKHYPVPTEVASILKVACNDCHSNTTRYPWYASIQPVGWWLNDHVEHGKGHLNFSEFTHRRIAIQNHKFEEIIETVEDGFMPLDDYTAFGLHPEANLDDAQRQMLIDWARAQMSSIAAEYPADSLVLRRRK